MPRSARTLLLLTLLATLPLTAGGCADLPTQTALGPDEADLTKLAGALTADDFDYILVRHPGADLTYVNRINTRGEMVGDFFDGTRWDGFTRRGDVYTTISLTGSTATFALGINERGDVVGHANIPLVGLRAYLLSGGSYQILDAPAGYHTRAFDISANGIIAGSYHTGAGKWQPAVWEEGVFRPLSRLTADLGADMAEGFGINVHGQVVGHYTVAGDFFPGTAILKMYGFVYGDDRSTGTLNYPGSGTMSCGWGIGVHGDVVGHYTDIATAEVGVSGYVWSNGRFTARLVVPGAVGTYPQAITPNGVIAGYAALGRPNPDGPGYIAEEWVGFTAVQKRPGRR
jgi:hypothetical protein